MMADQEHIIFGQRSPEKSKGKALYVGPDGQSVTIEELALEHYKTQGCQGLWSENIYWWQITTLLYWDVIYARLPEVSPQSPAAFPSMFIDIPADMFSDEFYQRRQKMIRARHRALSESSFFGLR